MSRTNDIREVKRLTKEIEAGELQLDPAKWRRADLLAGLSDDGMTQEEIAAETGISQSSVSIQIKVSRLYDVRNNRPSYTDAYYGIRGGTGNETNAPRKKMTVTEKVELVRELVADPVVRAAVEPQMSEPIPRAIHPEPSLTQEWEAWLNRLNSLLIDGAKLADRGEGRSAYAAAARMFYDRITERKLDAEIRAFFEEVDA